MAHAFRLSGTHVILTFLGYSLRALPPSAYGAACCLVHGTVPKPDCSRPLRFPRAYPCYISLGLHSHLPVGSVAQRLPRMLINAPVCFKAWEHFPNSACKMWAMWSPINVLRRYRNRQCAASVAPFTQRGRLGLEYSYGHKVVVHVAQRRGADSGYRWCIKRDEVGCHCLGSISRRAPARTRAANSGQRGNRFRGPAVLYRSLFPVQALTGL